MAFPPLEPTDYIMLGLWKEKESIVHKTKHHWKKAKDREFCLSVLDENRLSVIGLPDPVYWRENPSSWEDGWDQTWIYTKGEGWAKSSPMPKITVRGHKVVTSGTTCERITTKEECEKAAKELGYKNLSNDEDFVAVEKEGDGVPYCYLSMLQNLIFNKNGGSTKPCSGLSQCFCKTTRGKGASIYDVRKSLGIFLPPPLSTMRTSYIEAP